MKKIYKHAEELIGNTPLLEMTNIERDFSVEATLLGKVESFNPAGSAKDRVGLHMIDVAEAQGKLTKGSTIIEPTSGNTGIGLAAVGTSRGYRVIIVMPDSMSVERQKLMKAYGAELVLTDGSLGMKGAIEKANELAEKYPGSFIPDQFNNPANAEAHYLTTGPEIWRDTEGEVDIFVAGIGTGGTLTGTGRYLKEKNNSIKVVGVEPAGSPLISKGYSGKHDLQGIGANFIPQVLDRSIYDEIITVTDEDAYATGRLIGTKEGILVGITGGAAMWAAMQLAKRPENKGKTIVALLPDTGDHYLSTKMFE